MAGDIFTHSPGMGVGAVAAQNWGGGDANSCYTWHAAPASAVDATTWSLGVNNIVAPSIAPVTSGYITTVTPSESHTKWTNLSPIARTQLNGDEYLPGSELVPWMRMPWTQTTNGEYDCSFNLYFKKGQRIDSRLINSVIPNEAMLTLIGDVLIERDFLMIPTSKFPGQGQKVKLPDGKYASYAFLCRLDEDISIFTITDELVNALLKDWS